MKYQCSQCGLAVIVLPNEQPIKGCLCDAPILANMVATAHGAGGVTT